MSLCDACGLEVPPDDAVEVALSVGGLMCETPMTLHRGCRDKALDILGPPGTGPECSAEGFLPVSGDEFAEAPPDKYMNN